MKSSLDDRVAAIPAWVEEEFRRNLRRGHSPCVEHYAERCSGQESAVRAYLELLEFVEWGSATITDGPLDLPTRVGDYEVTALLGCGAMSSVYRGRHVPTGTDVALKVLASERSSCRERFAQEAAVLQRLRHRAIVRLLDSTLIEGMCIHVLSLIDGESLDQRVADWTDDERQRQADTLVRWARETASAVAHAHEQGVLHRDIKPDNMLVTGSGQIYLMDFGLSRMLDAATRVSGVGDVIGTPRYMAPEQFRGRCDVRSDLYAWGVTMWELMTGHRPWDGELTAPAASAVDLPPVRHHARWLPSQVARLIDQCCHFDPRYRPRSAADVCQHLNVCVPQVSAVTAHHGA